MKKLAFSIILLLAAVAVFGGPAVPPIIQDDRVYQAVAAEVAKWSVSPLSTTTCTRAAEPDQCCPIKGDCAGFGNPFAECVGLDDGPFASNLNQCTALAASIPGNIEFWTRQIYSCIQQDGDFACDLGYRGNVQTLQCTTLPGANVILDTASKCLSIQAATSFSSVP